MTHDDKWICQACQEGRHRMCEDPENCLCPKAVEARYQNEDYTAHLKRLEMTRKREPIHIRLCALSQVPKQNPTELHISIEEGGTLTDMNGKVLWSGFVSVESFEETMAEYKKHLVTA